VSGCLPSRTPSGSRYTGSPERAKGPANTTLSD
jgi:hypothetical protein